jgi:hypothetical protein
MYDDPVFFDNYVEKIPIGMKRKFVFYDIQFCKYVKISHLLDHMHILKIVSYSLWRHISLKKCHIGC